MLKHWQDSIFLNVLTTNRKLFLKYSSGKKIQWNRPVFGKNGNVEMKIFRVRNKWRCATSRTVPGSIRGGVTWDFFRGSFRQNHVPWGRLSLWKWVPGISPGVKAASVFGWRPATLVVPKVEKIEGLNLPGTPLLFYYWIFFTSIST